MAKKHTDDMPLCSKAIPPSTIYCDNQVALLWTSSGSYNGKSRQVHLKHNYVRGIITDEITLIQYVKSKSNLPDPLSKALKHQRAWVQSLSSCKLFNTLKQPDEILLGSMKKKK